MWPSGRSRVPLSGFIPNACVATLRGGLLVVWRNGEEAARKGGRPSSSSLRGLICAWRWISGRPAAVDAAGFAADSTDYWWWAIDHLVLPD